MVYPVAREKGRPPANIGFCPKGNPQGLTAFIFTFHPLTSTPVSFFLASFTA